MAENIAIDNVIGSEYKHGFETKIESDTFAPGLDEDVVKRISAKKNEPQFLLEWRLKAFRHWKTMAEPNWSKLDIEPIDYQKIRY